MNDTRGSWAAERWPIIELILEGIPVRHPRLQLRLEECEVYDWVLAESVPEWDRAKGSHLLGIPDGLPRTFSPNRCIVLGMRWELKGDEKLVEQVNNFGVN